MKAKVKHNIKTATKLYNMLAIILGNQIRQVDLAKKLKLHESDISAKLSEYEHIFDYEDIPDPNNPRKTINVPRVKIREYIHQQGENLKLKSEDINDLVTIFEAYQLKLAEYLWYHKEEKLAYMKRQIIVPYSIVFQNDPLFYLMVEARNIIPDDFYNEFTMKLFYYKFIPDIAGLMPGQFFTKNGDKELFMTFVKNMLNEVEY